MISSLSTVSRMMMRSISWLSPSMLFRNLGGVDLEMGMGIRMVLGIWDWEWKRGKGTMLLQKCVYGSTNIPAVGKTSLLCNPVWKTPTQAELNPHIHTLYSLSTAKKLLSSIIIHKPPTTESSTIESPLLLSLRLLILSIVWCKCSFSIYSPCSYDFSHL